MKSAISPRKGLRRAFWSSRRRRPELPVAAHAELLEDRTLLAVSSAFIPGPGGTGTLQIVSDNNDPIVVTGTSPGTVLINGLLPTDGPIDPILVVELIVIGGQGPNRIDLSGVFGEIAGPNTAFANLTGANISVTGGDGNDTIFASEIGGFYDGGNGDDSIVGDNTFNAAFPAGPFGITVVGGDGNDCILGGLGADSIVGGNGNDTIDGSNGNDTLTGDDGADSIWGGAGNDVIRGGAGRDTLMGDSTLTGSTDPATQGADSILGDADDDLIYGGGGADTLRGSGNNDTLIGGFGNDMVHGDAGNDLVFGGELIDDTLRNDGNDSLFGELGHDTIHGGTGDDSILGGDGNDVLNGNDGQDTLNGMAGADLLNGGNDEDRLLGGSGADTLQGSFDDDTLLGQAGNDRLEGGAGVDSLDGGDGNDTLMASPLQIVYLDFVSGFDLGEHIYLNEDRNENGILDIGEDSNGNGILDNDHEFIKNLLEADFANFEIQFTRVRPTSGDFVTIVFNQLSTTTFPDVPFFTIGRASERDFRNVSLNGTAEVDLNAVLAPLTVGDPVDVVRQKFNLASAYVAGHELGNLMGLRNADAFGPIGINPATGNPFALAPEPGTDAGFNLTPGDFTPIFPGPGDPLTGGGDADESIFHIMAAPTAFQTDFTDGIIALFERNPFLSERSAIKLAFADTGNIERELRPDEVNPTVGPKTYANAQPLTLRNLGTPNSLQFGRNASFELNVMAAAVWDGVIRNQNATNPATGAPLIPVGDVNRSEDDFYSFTASAGEIVQIEVHSEQLRRFVDSGRNINTILRVFGPTGRPVDYFVGRDPNLTAAQQATIRTDSAVNDRFRDDSVDVPFGSGNFFSSPDQDPIIISLEIPPGTPANSVFRVMVSEPYARGIFAIPIDHDNPLIGGFQETGDIVELDPITGVELNRLDVDVITGVLTSTPGGLAGGAAVAFDPATNRLYYTNPTRSDQLFWLDPNTGAILNQVTLPMAAAVLPGLHGMALLNSDNLVLVDVVNDDLYRISPSGVLLDKMDLDNISENLLGDGGTTVFPSYTFTGTGQPVTNAERSTWQDFQPGTFNPEGGDTGFVSLNPFGVGMGGIIGGRFQLVEGKAHDPGMGAPNTSPYSIYFDRTSAGNPDDIDVRFDFQITDAKGTSEGFAAVLGSTAAYGLTGKGPVLPGNGAGGIEAAFANSLSFVFDTRDNGTGGPTEPNFDHLTIYLNGVALGTFPSTVNMNDGAVHTARLLVQARDSSGQVIIGGGSAGVTGTEISVFVDGVVRGTVFVPGTDGLEYQTVIGESRLFFYSNVDGTTNFGTASIDNLRADFRVPLVRNVTAGLAVARQIPDPLAGLNGSDATLARVLIFDIDDQGNQIVHEVAPFTGLGNVTALFTGAVTSTFQPNTVQGINNRYVAIGVHHLHNNGIREDGLSVGTQVYLGTGQGVTAGQGGFQVHAFNRDGAVSPFTGLPSSGFTQSIGSSTTWDSAAAPTFVALTPVSLLDGTAGGVASSPAFFLTPQGNPTYNLKDFGADDNIPDRVATGNYELYIYKITSPTLTTVDVGVGETLNGGTGDDSIRGSSSNDVLRGGAGRDRIDGRAGKDTIFGGGGNDTLLGGNGDDSLIGETGVDDFFGGDGDDTVVFESDSGSDGTIEGGAGTDVLEIRTGSKNDTIVLEANGSKLKATVTAPNQDPVTLNSEVLEVLSIMTFQGNDTVIIRDLTPVVRLQQINIDLDGGADLLDASLQIDPTIRIHAFGGTGNDTLIGGAGRDSLEGNDGADSILGGRGRDTLLGGAGADTLRGGDDEDVIFGGDDVDFIFGDAGNDTLVGDAGDDVISGGLGADSLRGSVGADSLDGGDGNDTLLGELGDDTLRGGLGADTLSGDDGVDSLDGGDHNDTLSGGNDDDTLVGGTGDDLLFGNENEDFLNGMEGADTLDGGNGDDRLLGGAGNDFMIGGFGRDTINGNAGNDSIRGGHGDDNLLGGMGNDTINGGDGHDTISGDDGDDALAGHNGNDLINGGAGKDTLIGWDGDDTLRGGTEEDFLVGGHGNDNLDGQGSIDTLSGGQGFDTMTGLAEDVVNESIEAFFDPAKPEFAWINQV